MAESGLIKLLVEEPEKASELFSFEQQVIKIGRGRVGKSKKGVDVQLTDPNVGRVHAVIHMQAADDVFIMDMGSKGTYVDEKKISARQTINSGCKVKVGETLITVYFGEEAESIEAPSAPVEAPEDGVLESSTQAPSEAKPEAILDPSFLGGGSKVETNPYQEVITLTKNSTAQETSPPSTVVGTSPLVSSVSTETVVSETPLGSEKINVTAPDSQEPPMSQMSMADLPMVPQGYNCHPMHQTPQMMFGPVGPSAPALPETYTGPNLQMLLEVSDRLGKEFWYHYSPMW